MMVTKKLDIVYAHVDHPSHKDNELHSQIRDLLSQYGQVHGVVAHEVETLIRADVLVIETTIPDVLTVFLAGRAFEIGIRVLQLSKPALGPRCPGTIPGSTHYVYSSAGDLRRIIDGYFQL